MFGVPGQIVLFDDAPGAGIDLHQIRDYIGTLLPQARITVEGPFFARPGLPVEEVARKFARARVRNVFARAVGQDAEGRLAESPLHGEVAYERRRLEGRAGAVFGIPYDGFKIQQLAASLLPRLGRGQGTGDRDEEPSALSGAAVVVFTNQLLGSWGADDRRFHLRAAIFGFPSLISTSGIVEAPAKPRGYYYLRDRLAVVSQPDLAVAEAEKEFAGCFLVHGDPRLTEVAKGYVIQAIFFHATGDPFCGDPHCRLFNAHWQEELLRSQLGKPEFCERHERLLRSLRPRRGEAQLRNEGA